MFWQEVSNGNDHYLVGIKISWKSFDSNDLLSIAVTDMTRFWRSEHSASDIRRVSALSGIQVAHGKKSMQEYLDILCPRDRDRNTTLELLREGKDIKLTISKREPELRLQFELQPVEEADGAASWRELVTQLFGTVFVMDKQIAAIRREIKRKDMIIKLMLEKLYTLQRDPWLVSSTMSAEEVDEEKQLRENKWMQELVTDKQLFKSLYKFDWDNMQSEVQSRVPEASLWNLMEKILRDRTSWEIGSRLGFDGKPQELVEDSLSEEDTAEPVDTSPIKVDKRKFGKISTESPQRELKKRKRNFGKNSA